MNDTDLQPAPMLARIIARMVTGFVALCVVGILGLMYYWDDEPDLFDVRGSARPPAGTAAAPVTGSFTTATLIRVMRQALYKPGGYLSNDVAPPGVLMDNIPRWEFGVVTQSRDLVRALRNDFSRSQTQSTEDDDLVIADPKFHVDTESWLLPSAEAEYGTGIEALESYLARLSDDDPDDAQFYARADNLADWLAVVEKRLGSLSQRLSASVGQLRINTDLQGDSAATQAKRRTWPW